MAIGGLRDSEHVWLLSSQLGPVVPGYVDDDGHDDDDGHVDDDGHDDDDGHGDDDGHDDDDGQPW